MPADEPQLCSLEGCGPCAGAVGKCGNYPVHCSSAPLCREHWRLHTCDGAEKLRLDPRLRVPDEKVGS